MLNEREKTRKTIQVFAAMLGIAVCIIMLLLPFPARNAEGEQYTCRWSDGSVSKESYASAYASLYGMDESGIILYCNGKVGRIFSHAGKVYSVLNSGDMNEVLSCVWEGGAGIEGAALYRTYSRRIWYDGAYYIWTGSRVEKVGSATGDELVLLNGSVTAGNLKKTGATTLYLRSASTVKAAMFSDSCITSVFAQEPYSSHGGAIYLNTAGGKRLLAGLSAVQSLAIDEDTLFMDEGALLPCGELNALTVPFAGNMADASGSMFCGMLAVLFSNGKEYRIPSGLERVRVTGGRVGEDAFYRLENLREINLCGVESDNISYRAFNGLTRLEILHSPKEIPMNGFTAVKADCGCTVYVKNGR